MPHLENKNTMFFRLFAVDMGHGALASLGIPENIKTMVKTQGIQLLTSLVLQNNARAYLKSWLE